MNEIIIKIKELIKEKINIIEKTLEELENDGKLEQYNIAKRFMDNYNNLGVIDFDALALFFDNLNIDKSKNIEYYINLHQLVGQVKESNNYGVFNSYIELYNKEFDSLIMAINSYVSKLVSSLGKIGFEKRELTDLISQYSKFNKILETINNNFVISSDDYSFLVDFVLGLENISDEMKLNFVCFVAKQNCFIMNKNIELASSERRKKQEEQHKNLEEVIRDERNESVVDSDSIEENVDLNTCLEKFLSEEQLNMYNTAKEISLRNFSQNVDYDEIIEFCSSNNFSLSDRISYYSVCDSFGQQYCIVNDLKNNLLLKFENKILNNDFDKDLFDVISGIVLYYQKLIEEEKRLIEEEKLKEMADSTDYLDLLDSLGMIDKVNKLKEVDDFINQCFIEFDDNKVLEATILSYIIDLNNSKDELKNSVKDCFVNKSDDSIKMVNLFFDEVINKYNYIKEVYNNFSYSAIEENDKYLNYTNDFYNGLSSVKNIVVFPFDDGSLVPIIESDIENDVRVHDKDKSFKSNLKKLGIMIGNDFVAKQGQDKDNLVKAKGYSEEFLEEFKIKRATNGHSRIFYGRYKTSLSEIFPEFDADTHLLFVFEIGYANVDGKQKEDIYTESLARCRDDKESIRRIKDLFNTDWSMVSETEKQKRIKMIREYLTRQNIKFGHFIEKCESKNLSKAVK